MNSNSTPTDVDSHAPAPVAPAPRPSPQPSRPHTDAGARAQAGARAEADTGGGPAEGQVVRALGPTERWYWMADRVSAYNGIGRVRIEGELRPPLEDLIPAERGTYRPAELLRTVRSMAREQRQTWARKPVRITGQKKVPFAERRWGLVHHTLHADDLHALLTESRRQRTTVHGALSATLVRATVEHRAELFSAEDQPGGAGATRITLGSPVDLRSRLREPVEPYEVGAFVSMLRTNVDHDPDRDLWDEARAITDELRTRQEHGEDFCMLHISRWVVPNTAKRSERTLEAVEKGNPQNLALSNFGRVDFPDSAGSLRLSGVHLAASLGASCYLGATVITAHNTLSLNLNYLREAISDETARSIATRWYTLIRLRAALVKNP